MSLFKNFVSANLQANIWLQGKYTVFADAYTKEGKKIVCMEATVVF